MTASRKKSATRRPKAALPTEAIQSVLLEIIAAMTAGIQVANECALAAMPADMLEADKRKVSDAILLSGISTVVSLGRISADAENRTNPAADDRPVRDALAEALIVAFNCHELIENEFMKGLTQACRPPLH